MGYVQFHISNVYRCSFYWKQDSLIVLHSSNLSHMQYTYLAVFNALCMSDVQCHQGVISKWRLFVVWFIYLSVLFNLFHGCVSHVSLLNLLNVINYEHINFLNSSKYGARNNIATHLKLLGTCSEFLSWCFKLFSILLHLYYHSQPSGYSKVWLFHQTSIKNGSCVFISFR
jgi:hypothetical protein